MTDATPLTPEQIDAQTAALTPDQARARLSELEANNDFGKRLFSGDVNANREWKGLFEKLSGDAGAAGADAGAEKHRPTDIEGKAIPLPDNNIFLSPAERDARQLAETIDHLESHGFPDRNSPTGKELWGALDGKIEITPEYEKRVQNKFNSLERDSEWRRRFFAGEEQAVNQFHVATTLLAAAKGQRPR